MINRWGQGAARLRSRKVSWASSETQPRASALAKAHLPEIQVRVETPWGRARCTFLSRSTATNNKLTTFSQRCNSSVEVHHPQDQATEVNKTQNKIILKAQWAFCRTNVFQTALKASKKTKVHLRRQKTAWQVWISTCLLTFTVWFKAFIMKPRTGKVN